MLIDIHCHTSYFSDIERSNGSKYPSPKQLIEMLDRAGIDKAVVLSTVSPECRFVYVTPEQVREICMEYPDRLIPFCNIDPRMFTNSAKSNFLPLLEHYKSLGFKGMGEYFPNIPLDDPLNINVFKQVEEIGFPLIFHLAHKIGAEYGCFDELHLPRLENVLKKCPNLTFLGHSQVFWSELSSTVTEQDRYVGQTGKVTPGRLVQLMEDYPNLHGDLSAYSGYNAISRDLEFGCWFLERFQDRLYFGTDIANVPQKLNIVGYFRKIDSERLISKDAFEKITYKNAVKLLGIK